ncbi:MAG: tetratricopeptide repeat protein [Propylenella sp.]
MANDERRTDTFIREVDEELRREQLKALWDRFGWLFIGACVLIVAITAGYRGWIWWEERRAAQAGDRFLAAIEAIERGSRAEGEAQLNAIAEEGGSGYAALARLKLAGDKVAAGEKEAALAAYDTFAGDMSLGEPLRDLARIRAALLALDAGDAAGAVERAETLNVPGRPWRHAAREVLGTAAYATGDLRKAREYFASIQEDAETPADIWQRSGLMISLIDGQLGDAGSEADTEKASDAEPETETAEEGLAEEGASDGAAPVTDGQ